MDPINKIEELSCLIQQANQSFITLVCDQTIFNKAVFAALENRELIPQNKVLLAEWENLSINAAKYLDLPINSTALLALKRVRAYVSQQFFFLDGRCTFCDDVFKPILSHLDSYNPYSSPFSAELATLASVSKKWNCAIDEMQISNAAKHNHLKEQENLLLNANFETAEETIDFIIEKNLEIANLKKFTSLTDEHLERLFQGSPNLKHLIIESNQVRKLPQQSEQLQTLSCENCSQINLPDRLSNLISLNCSSSFGLKNLPDMPNLTDLNCHNCWLLTCLPENFSRLNKLNCSSCYGLKSLPDLPQLTTLNCNDCWQLAILPDMPKLISLECSYCEEFKILPSLPQLKRLSCLHCPNLTISSAWLPKAATL